MIALAIAVTVAAQDEPELSFEVKDSVGYNGVVQSLNEDLSLRQAAGLVFIQTYSLNAGSTRFRFRVDQAPNTPFEVRSIGRRGTIEWSYRGTADFEGTFWSGALRPPFAVIQVLTDAPTSSFRISIDRKAESRVGVHPKSLFARKLLPIEQESAAAQALGRSVVLLELTDQYGMYPCTGWVIAPSTIITNYHCIPSDEVCDSAIVKFDFDANGKTLEGRLTGLGPKRKGLDFTIAHYVGEVRSPLGTALTPPKTTDDLILIGHPEGKGKKVSRALCSISLPGSLVTGSDRTKKTDYPHTCDTLGGNSGSPVINEAGMVVGLHHLGIRRGFPTNQAVDINLILKAIGEDDPALYRTITGKDP